MYHSNHLNAGLRSRCEMFICNLKSNSIVHRNYAEALRLSVSQYNIRKSRSRLTVIPNIVRLVVFRLEIVGLFGLVFRYQLMNRFAISYGQVSIRNFHLPTFFAKEWVTGQAEPLWSRSLRRLQHVVFLLRLCNLDWISERTLLKHSYVDEGLFVTGVRHSHEAFHVCWKCLWEEILQYADQSKAIILQFHVCLHFIVVPSLDGWCRALPIQIGSLEMGLINGSPAPGSISFLVQGSLLQSACVCSKANESVFQLSSDFWNFEDVLRIHVWNREIVIFVEICEISWNLVKSTFSLKSVKFQEISEISWNLRNLWNLVKSCEIPVKSWFRANSGDFEQILVISSEFWWFRVILSDFGSFLPHFGHFRVILSDFGAFLAIFGSFWPFLGHFGHFRVILAISGVKCGPLLFLCARFAKSLC